MSICTLSSKRNGSTSAAEPALGDRAILPGIGRPTLVIGGEDDRVIEAKAQREMAQLIPTSCLKIYPGYGHGNSFVNPDYPRQVTSFLQEVMAPSASQE